MKFHIIHDTRDKSNHPWPLAPLVGTLRFMAHALRMAMIPVIIGLSLGGPSARGESAWASFKQGAIHSFSGPRLWIWGVGSALTLAAFAYDHDVYRHHIAREDWQPANFVGDNFGTGVPGAVLAIGAMVGGRALGKETIFRSGWGHAEALVAAFLLTTAMKGSIARPRPEAYSGNDNAFNSSFPSGHTSTVFATAGSLWAFHGPMVGAPAMILAAMAGYSRVQHGVHYLSDALLGSTLGLATGFGFAEVHLRRDSAQGAQGAGIRLRPFFVSSRSLGVLVNGTF